MNPLWYTLHEFRMHKQHRNSYEHSKDFISGDPSMKWERSSIWYMVPICIIIIFVFSTSKFWYIPNPPNVWVIRKGIKYLKIYIYIKNVLFYYKCASNNKCAPENIFDPFQKYLIPVTDKFFHLNNIDCAPKRNIVS